MADFWRTRDGRKIPIREMEGTHLVNAMQFLRRAHQRYVGSVIFLGIPDDIGEMAREAAEEEMANAADSTVEQFYPIYNDLHLEAIRRGLIK